MSAVKYPQGLLIRGGITFRKQVDSSGVLENMQTAVRGVCFHVSWSLTDRAGPIMPKSLMIMPCCTAHKLC